MLILMAVCQCFFSLSYAFTHYYKGNTVSYTVVSEARRTCEVASNGENAGVSGNLVLPAQPGGYTLVSIRNYAFKGCSELTSVELPGTVDKIGNGAFSGCSKLESISIPESVSSIGAYAFEYCTALKKTEFGSLASLCWITFENQSANPLAYSHRLYIDGKEITDLVIPPVVGILRDYTFYGCSRLTSVEIPSTITSIGKSTFVGCSKLEQVVLPNSVTSVDYTAFRIPNLRKCAYPSTLTLSPFYYGVSIKYPAKDAIIENGCVYGKDKKKLYFVPLNMEGEFVVPETVEIIGDYAFWDCCELTSVILSDSLLSIGEYAFYNCFGLSSLKIPGKVTTIGDEAFQYCRGLTSLVIPDSVTTIGSSAFMSCDNLRSLTIGKSVEQIGKYAFKSCNNLTEITCFPLNPPIAKKASFRVEDPFSNYSATLKVPYNSLPLYKDAQSDNCWHLFENITYLEAEPVVAESIVLSDEKWCGKVGETIALSATVIPDNAIDKTVVWSSSDEGVATVSSDGLVTGVSVGTATITATCAGASALCEITVMPVLAERVSLNIDNTGDIKTGVSVGETLQLYAGVAPENTTDKTIVWRSSDEGVATVSPDGLVTGVSVGKATITATCGEVYAACEIPVLPILAHSISLNVDNARIALGETLQLSATILPENTTDKTVEWSSWIERVATVSSDGLVTGVSEGSTTITAKCGQLYAYCHVAVCEIMAYVEEIVLNPVSVVDNVGNTFKISAIVLPEDATNKSLRWSSSNYDVATVEDGIVSLLKEGSAIITAEACDGSWVKAECSVVVSDNVGLEEIIADKDSDVKIFTINGDLVYEGIYADSKVAPGIYIVVCRNRIVKAKID